MTKSALAAGDACAISVTLTDKEVEVLRWCSTGKSSLVIANEMGVTQHAVNFHLRNIFEKLGVENKISAVVVAIKLGLLRIY